MTCNMPLTLGPFVILQSLGNYAKKNMHGGHLLFQMKADGDQSALTKGHQCCSRKNAFAELLER